MTTILFRATVCKTVKIETSSYKYILIYLAKIVKLIAQICKEKYLTIDINR